MSKILQRIEDRKKAKASSMPSDVTNQIADKYVADLEQKAYEKAQLEIRHELMEVANEAEMEGYRQKIDAAAMEVETARMLLTQAQSETVQLNDLVKSLKAELNNNSIAMEDLVSEHKSAMKEQNQVIERLKDELNQERSKPIPVTPPIIQQSAPIPEFEFIPIKGMDGRIQSVTAKPKYETN